MAPKPTVVVDVRYCAPHATDFTVTETLFGDFAVKDAGDAAVIRIESVAFTLSRRYLLRDVSAASRRPVLTVQRSLSLFGIGRRWEAYRGNSTSHSNLLFDAVEGPSLFTRADIRVHLAGRGERDPDFILAARGFSSREYTVSGSGGGVAAQIKRTRRLLFGEYYNVSVKAGVDHAFIPALTAILEDICLDDVRQKRT